MARQTSGDAGDSISLQKLALRTTYPVGIHLDEALANPGSTKDVELKEQGVDFYGINLILPVNESTALITAFTNTGNKFYELDLKNYTTKALDAKDYEWLDADEIRNAKTINGNIYYKTPIGIFKIDTENKTTEKVLDYSECNVNRTLLDSLETTDCDGDTFTLCGK